VTCIAARLDMTTHHRWGIVGPRCHLAAAPPQ